MGAVLQQFGEILTEWSAILGLGLIVFSVIYTAYSLAVKRRKQVSY